MSYPNDPRQPPGPPPAGGPYAPQPMQQPVYGAPIGYDPAAPYGVHPMTGLPYSDKQKIVAALLQFFLGGFGAGRFYTGHTGLAIAQIAVVWLTCGMGAIWPLIDGVMMLSGSVPDADGRPLRD